MRIIVADPYAGPRCALMEMFGVEPALDLVGEAVDSQGLLALVVAQAPELVLVDYRLPGLYIEDLIARLHGFTPRPIVIVMSNEIECSRLALKAGADAFVSKTENPDWLLLALRKYIRPNPKKEGGENHQ